VDQFGSMNEARVLQKKPGSSAPVLQFGDRLKITVVR
jgi:hypothetical protein